jgi:hypothetical protein
VDRRTALNRLQLGAASIAKQRKDWERRDDYYRGRQDLPYAPQGVNEEYQALQEMAIANWLALAMNTPLQRLRVDGFRTGGSPQANKALWDEVWQPNKLDARQRLVYVAMMVHDRGLMSVWPNEDDPRSPVIRPESSRRVHLEPDPEDPSRTEWAVKTFTLRVRPESTIWTPQAVVSTREVGLVYDADSWARYERVNGAGEWRFVNDGGHPLGEPPFVPYSLNADEDGGLHPSIEPLMPQQDAINTVRFNTLLAMQFSAFRQRVFTGYDPVVRDDKGVPVWQKNTDGTLKLDANGQPMPVLTSPGRIGVDRALVFPGADTKVFDLPESNLRNYIDVLGEFLTQFFATSQIPPQYLLTRMANLSGDALAGAESTLQALVSDIKAAVGESHEHTMRLAGRARGDAAENLSSEVIWGDGEARSFAQTVDAITKLISIGFPRRPAFEMIPGATTTKVDEWMRLAEQQDAAALAAGMKAIAESQPPGPSDVAAGNG